MSGLGGGGGEVGGEMGVRCLRLREWDWWSVSIGVHRFSYAKLSVKGRVQLQLETRQYRGISMISNALIGRLHCLHSVSIILYRQLHRLRVIFAIYNRCLS
jgi:hypothetical protein